MSYSNGASALIRVTARTAKGDRIFLLSAKGRLFTDRDRVLSLVGITGLIADCYGGSALICFTRKITDRDRFRALT